MEKKRMEAGKPMENHYAEMIESRIYTIRSQRVMIDFDLAELYGVKTKVLKRSVKRNLSRFPADFMFELTDNEQNELVTNCDRLRRHLKHSSVAVGIHGAWGCRFPAC